jgi:hypothetical protein
MKLDFFKPSEKFLILEILPKSANGLFLSVDEDRNLVFEKFIEHVDLKKLVKSPVRRISEKRWEGKNLFNSRRRVIAMADPSVATTIPIPLELDRRGDMEKEKITVMELENSVAQEMKRIFNGCRSEASKRLGIDELSTILVGSKVEHMAVDGKPVADAAGRSGKKISFLLELIFTSREIFESLKDFFSSPEGFFFVESPQAHLQLLSRVRSLPVNLLADMRHATSDKQQGISLFIFQKPAQKNAQAAYPVLYREMLNWNFDSLLGEIATAFSVSRAVAGDLYRAYSKGKMSEGAMRHFKKILDPATERLLKEIERAKISGCVYVDARFALPFPLPHKHQGAIFEHVPVEEILKKFDFEADSDKWVIPSSAISRYLAPFLEAYFDKDSSEINRKLRRRLHWLAE